MYFKIERQLLFWEIVIVTHPETLFIELQKMKPFSLNKIAYGEEIEAKISINIENKSIMIVENIFFPRWTHHITKFEKFRPDFFQNTSSLQNDG